MLTLLRILISLLFVLALAACGDDEGTKTDGAVDGAVDTAVDVVAVDVAVDVATDVEVDTNGDAVDEVDTTLAPDSGGGD